ncbi:WcbI family polysaccharide biosynthesis putative acetyltransferase [Rhodococcus sp. G-MC3]|uniref:WcbI family polysaccharide biosynthesis putative acetyltransferase n=1 Tax=Rhodococcus sp. G-MC3 TaxID=3046209 RepID=UPI0024BA9554|nr:WcbI family polysaccharide biosynthesis putative acetyltransferase [Rhodococcus sp. G-MC3]MDJ0392867.1 WcbI family polysaccharide biosynthesis putative acetyltransferase [Rhodococcus sp. G-MC3]
MATTEYYSAQRAAAPSARDAVDGRTRHYGEFYRVTEPPVRDRRPLVLVWGNCQAEALRIVLSSSPDAAYRTIRVPPVHELTASDMPFVSSIAEAADVLVSQPVRAGYRGLPIGTAEVRDRSKRPSRTIVWPVVRYCGMFPFQVIVRHPDSPSAVPPAVPYHDLRTLLGVREGRRRFDEWDFEVGEERLRAVADWSVGQLRSRELRNCDVGISDVLLGLGERAAHTINHPGNDGLLELGRRILSTLGCTDPTPPERELLGNIRAPLEKRVIDAFGLHANAREEWTVDGASLGQEEIFEVQSRWYLEHPQFVTAAFARYAELVDILGLTA